MTVKITLKTLQQQTFTVDIDDTETVKKLKEKIEGVKGADNFPVVGQKLIYAGKILEDDKTIQECKIEPNNFIVVMVTKPKATPKPAESKPAETAAAAAPTPAATSQPAETKEEKKEEKKEEASAAATEMEDLSTTPASTATTTPAVGLDEASNRLATGSQYEQAITNLESMGFTRDLVTRAMSQAYNCPDRAAEFLISGTVSAEDPVVAPPFGQSPAAPTGTIPTGAVPTGAVPTGTASTGTAPASIPASIQAVDAPAGGSMGSTGGEGNPLAFLRDQPQFQHMADMVHRNPRQLPEFLQQIGQRNPELLRLINENQESFLEMLNEHHESQAGGTTTVQITPEDKAAIDELKDMGFRESLCVQAYFACDKNVELAANFIMNEMMDESDS